MFSLLPQKKKDITDTAETVEISSLALLKMLKHGRAGVPIEVMGLMLGEFVDDFTVKVVDVFSMPQNGTGVSVETIDEVFQQKMLDCLKQTGRTESVVGWYHSHPGFGCWLSGIDQEMQNSFEKLHPRCVAVVVDPIQSVRGKVVIDAFRLLDFSALQTVGDTRQITSNLGHLVKPTAVSLIHGLGREFYHLPISFTKSPFEERMLMNLNKRKWTDIMNTEKVASQSNLNQSSMKTLLSLSNSYVDTIPAEPLNAEGRALKNVGKLDSHKRLGEEADKIVESNAVNVFSAVVGTLIANTEQNALSLKASEHEDLEL